VGRRGERRACHAHTWWKRPGHEPAAAGALHAREELLALAETLSAPVVKTLSGKAAVPDDSPYTTGGIGLLGTRPSEELMSDVDTLLLVGTNFPYTKHLPPPGKVRVAQVEADPARAGARTPTELPVVGDSKQTLQALLPLLKQRNGTSFLSKYQKEMGKWRRNMASMVNADRDPIAPQYVAGLIDELATDDAVLTCDSGTIATWAARGWTIRGGRGFYLSGNLATMAPGLPYAIGIQHAFPGRQVIAYVGDGGFAMLMAEFLTAIQHKLPIKVVINNNNSLGQILWEQMVLGYPRARGEVPGAVRRLCGVRVRQRRPGHQGGAPRRRPRRDRPGARARRPGHRRRECQPGRAAAAREGRVRAGEEVHPGFPEGPAAQGHDCDHAVQRQDRAAQVVAGFFRTPQAPRRR